MMTIARTQDERLTLLAYLASKIGSDPAALVGSMPFQIGAVRRAGRAMGAVLYTNKRGTTIEMTWAGEPGWVTRGALAAMFGYAFRDLDCLTVVGTIRCDNEKSRDMAERIGCMRVGLVPHAFGEGAHGYLYCMCRDRCEWTARKAAPAVTWRMNGGLHGQRRTGNAANAGGA